MDCHFNQSNMLVTIETEDGLTGIGEGGSRDTLEQCAAMLIGENPEHIQHLWQLMYRGYFYPAGREKLHALGALDLALGWKSLVETFFAKVADLFRPWSQALAIGLAFFRPKPWMSKPN